MMYEHVCLRWKHPRTVPDTEEMLDNTKAERTSPVPSCQEMKYGHLQGFQIRAVKKGHPRDVTQLEGFEKD